MPVASRQRPPFKYQPIRGRRVELNPSHWLADHVVFAHTGEVALVMGAPTLPISNTIGRRRGRNIGTGPSWTGEAVNFFGSGSSFGVWKIPEVPWFPSTCVAWASDRGNTGIRTLIGVGNGALAGGYLRLAVDASERGQFLSVGGSTSTATSSSLITFNEVMQFVGVNSQSDLRSVYLNAGSKVSNTTTSAPTGGTGYIALFGTINTSITALPDVAKATNEYLAMPLFLSKALSDDEVTRLYDEQVRNPWQLFRERPTQIWLGSAAAPTLPTLSAATATDITATSFRPRVSYAY